MEGAGGVAGGGGEGRVEEVSHEGHGDTNVQMTKGWGEALEHATGAHIRSTHRDAAR